MGKRAGEEGRGAGGTTERRDMRARAGSLGSRMTAPQRFRPSFRLLVPPSRPASWEEDGPAATGGRGRPTSGQGLRLRHRNGDQDDHARAYAGRGTCFTLLARSLDRLFTSRATRSQRGRDTSYLSPLSFPNLLFYFFVANIIAVTQASLI